MELKNVLPVILGTVIFILKFSIGVNTPWLKKGEDAAARKSIIREIIVLLVSAPVIAYLLKAVFTLDSGIFFILVLLAASPAAPLSAIKVFKAGGNYRKAVFIQLLVILISVLSIPVTLYIFSLFSSVRIDISWQVLLNRILLVVFVPLGLGILFRILFKNLAVKFGPMLAKIANMLLSVVGVLILFSYRDHLFKAGLTELFILSLFVILLILSGHLLADGDVQNKKTTAILNSSRNIGIAVFISLPFVGLAELMPLMVPYVFVNVILGIIYIRFTKGLNK